jgi:aspartyl-tRNA(Asn)/glutamyl-tRNA(Gln) amidotransferase subunit B
MLEKLRLSLPDLPETLYEQMVGEYGLSPEDATLLIEDRPYAAYFQALLRAGITPKVAATWINVVIRAYLNAAALPMQAFRLAPETLADLIRLVESRQVSLNAAREEIFPVLVENPEKTPIEVAQEKDLLLLQNGEQIDAWIAEVLAENPEKVETYRKGKAGLLGFFVGQVVRRSGGKADPKEVQRRLVEKLA